MNEEVTITSDTPHQDAAIHRESEAKTPRQNHVDMLPFTLTQSILRYLTIIIIVVIVSQQLLIFVLMALLLFGGR